MQAENQNLLYSYIGPEGHVVHCNDDFARVLGRGLNLQGQSLRTIFPSLEARKLTEAIDACRNEPGLTVSLEITTRLAGVAHHFEWSVFTEEGGGIQLVGRDVTLERQGERERLQEARLLHNITDAIISTDASFRITAFNRAAEEIYGLSSSGVLGKGMAEVVSYHYPFTTREEALQQLTRNGHWRGIVHLQQKGGIQVLEGAVTAVRDEDGNITGYVAVNRPHSDGTYHEVMHQFQCLFGYIDDAVFLLDRDATLHFCNRQAIETLQRAYGVSVAVADNIIEKMPLHRRPVLRDFFDRVLQGETVRYELEVPVCGRSPIWLDCQYFPVRNRRGQLNFIGAIVKDVSARKALAEMERQRRQAQESLYHTRYMFEQFMENSPLVAWITDAEGRMTYMNPRYLDAYGLTNGDIGKRIDEIFEPAIAREYHANNQRVLRGGKPVETIEPAILSDGSGQVLKIFKFPLQLNGAGMVAGWAVDITQEERLREQLAQSLERFQLVNEATSDALFDWDLRSGELFRGHGYRRLFGYDEDMPMQFDLIHPADRTEAVKAMFDHINDESKDRWHLQYRYRTEDGTYRHVVSKAFIQREEGSPMRVIGTLQDISEQKELQARLVTQERKAKRAVVRSIIETQEKERRNLSVELHDNVNQMLASCKLMLEVAKENGTNAPLLTEKAYSGLQDVINEIRKISHDLNPSIIQDVGLEEAIQHLIESINLTGRLQIHFYHEDIRSDLKHEDRIAIYRIIQEQLSNILKYAEARRVEIGLVMTEGQTRLRIADDGVGFDTTLPRKGLGLKNIFHRVDYYQGTMEIFSQKGAGCELKVTLCL